MATGVNLSVFNFGPAEIRDINELVVETVLQAPELSVLHTIYPNIKTQQYIGFLGEGGLVGLKGQGCDPVPQDWGIPGRQLKWTPHTWEVFLSECWKDLENTMVIYAIKNGVDRSDLTTTDYMAITVQVLSAAIKKMIWRLVWFADENAKNVVNGGLITNGVNPEYFNLLDGLWKKILTALPASSEQRVSISANTGASYADQRAQLTGQMAYDALQNMVDVAPIVLRQEPGLLFACTQSFADAYAKYLKGKDIEATYTNLVEGVPALMFDGIPVVPFPVWDEMIHRYEDNGTKWNNPHRCILTAPSNLAIGVAGTNTLEDVDVWYDKTSRKNYMRATDDIDTLVLSEERIILAI